MASLTIVNLNKKVLANNAGTFNLISKGYCELPQGKRNGLFLYPKIARPGVRANEVMTVCR